MAQSIDRKQIILWRTTGGMYAASFEDIMNMATGVLESKPELCCDTPFLRLAPPDVKKLATQRLRKGGEGVISLKDTSSQADIRKLHMLKDIILKRIATEKLDIEYHVPSDVNYMDYGNI